MKYLQNSIFAIGAALCLAWAAPLPDPIVVNGKDNCTSISLKAGTSIEVRLGSNETTGYKWVVKKPNGKFVQEKSPKDYVLGNSTMPGAPGTQVFSYTLIKSGKTRMEWDYVRPGEKKHKGNVKTFKVSFKISR